MSEILTFHKNNFMQHMEQIPWQNAISATLYRNGDEIASGIITSVNRQFQHNLSSVTLNNEEYQDFDTIDIVFPENVITPRIEGIQQYNRFYYPRDYVEPFRNYASIPGGGNKYYYKTKKNKTKKQRKKQKNKKQ